MGFLQFLHFGPETSWFHLGILLILGGFGLICPATLHLPRPYINQQLREGGGGYGEEETTDKDPNISNITFSKRLERPRR